MILDLSPRAAYCTAGTRVKTTGKVKRLPSRAAHGACLCPYTKAGGTCRYHRLPPPNGQALTHHWDDWGGLWQVSGLKLKAAPLQENASPALQLGPHSPPRSYSRRERCSSLTPRSSTIAAAASCFADPRTLHITNMQATPGQRVSRQ